VLTAKIEGVFIRSYCCCCNLLYKKDDGNFLANDEKIRKNIFMIVEQLIVLLCNHSEHLGAPRDCFARLSAEIYSHTQILLSSLVSDLPWLDQAAFQP